MVTDAYIELTRHMNYINIKKSRKEKNMYMNNKRVKGWQNVDKLYAEYKQLIQKSSIEHLKGIVYIGSRPYVDLRIRL